MGFVYRVLDRQAIGGKVGDVIDVQYEVDFLVRRNIRSRGQYIACEVACFLGQCQLQRVDRDLRRSSTVAADQGAVIDALNAARGGVDGRINTCRSAKEPAQQR